MSEPKKRSASFGLGVIVGFSGACALGIAGLVFVAIAAKAQKDQAANTPEPAVQASRVDPEPPQVRTPAQRAAVATSLNDAIRILRPLMSDTDNGQVSQGAAALAVWSQQNLHWRDLQAMPDSARADVMKDPEAFRGRQLCASGTIVQIHADHSVSPPVFEGGLMTASSDMVRFLAVRSTSGLVENSAARLCGIITGLQSYPNTLGGTTHAVYVVGMFDIPENR